MLLSQLFEIEDFSARIYNAESDVEYLAPILTVKKAQNLLHSIIPKSKLIILPGKRDAYADNKNKTIKMTSDFLNKLLFIHEIAHLLQKGAVHHNSSFCRIYLQLVDTHLGKNIGQKLRKAFNDHDIIY